MGIPWTEIVAQQHVSLSRLVVPVMMGSFVPSMISVIQLVNVWALDQTHAPME